MNGILDTSEMLALSHLNKAQKRTIILRDELRFLDPRHLDTFIEGIGNPEPPPYKKDYHGNIYPPLVAVKIKPTAMQVDLGNVAFPNRNIRRVYLTYEAGNFEMRDTEPMPQEDDNLYSVPIFNTMAKHILPLFKAKFAAIQQRQRTLNDTRRFAFDSVLQGRPQDQHGHGKSLEKLHSVDDEVKERVMQDSGYLVPRNEYNKRKRVGIENVPFEVKSQVFMNIPGAIQADLFDAMAKAALPDVESLLVAAWNLVAVYIHAGSEDKVLHEAVTVLEGVLRKFEHSLKKPKEKREPLNSANTGFKHPDARDSKRSETTTMEQDIRPHPNSRESFRDSPQARLRPRHRFDTTPEDNYSRRPHSPMAYDRRTPRYMTPEHHGYHQRQASQAMSVVPSQRDPTPLRRQLEEEAPAGYMCRPMGHIQEETVPREDSPPPCAPRKPAAHHIEDDSDNSGKMAPPPNKKCKTMEPSASPEEGLFYPHDERPSSSASTRVKQQKQSNYYGMFTGAGTGAGAGGPVGTGEPPQHPVPAPSPEVRKAPQLPPQNQYYGDDLDDLFGDEGPQEHPISSQSEPQPQPQSEVILESEPSQAVFFGQSKLGPPKKAPNQSGDVPVVPAMYNAGKETSGEEGEEHAEKPS